MYLAELGLFYLFK